LERAEKTPLSAASPIVLVFVVCTVNCEGGLLALFYPYLDEILNSLKERFSDHRNLLRGLDSPTKSLDKTFSDLLPAIEFYREDLDHSNKDILESE